MELILFDENMQEIAPVYINADFEVGDADTYNNFEIKTAGLNAYGIYIPGTEFGGVFEYTKLTSNVITKTLRGWCWRGLLTQAIIIPDAGQDYKIVSGDANAIIKNVCQNLFGGFFSFPDTTSGCTISNYQFPLYVNVLTGLMDMLKAYNYRLKITADRDAPGGYIKVFLEAVPAADIQSDFDEDSRLNMTITANGMGINHLVCMGQGELQNRQRVDLYMDADGKVSRTKYFTGFQERIGYFDFTSAQSEQDLIDKGTSNLLEKCSTKTMKVTASDIEMEVGDFVTGRNIAMGISIHSPIYKKKLKITRAGSKIEYSVKGE